MCAALAVHHVRRPDRPISAQLCCAPVDERAVGKDDLVTIARSHTRHRLNVRPNGTHALDCLAERNHAFLSAHLHSRDHGRHLGVPWRWHHSKALAGEHFRNQPAALERLACCLWCHEEALIHEPQRCAVHLHAVCGRKVWRQPGGKWCERILVRCSKKT
eukprot:364707-Chlamydomonas_euryale.AAC.24